MHQAYGAATELISVKETLARLGGLLCGVVFCSIARTSPQPIQRKICSSLNDATLGSMKMSFIDILQHWQTSVD